MSRPVRWTPTAALETLVRFGRQPRKERVAVEFAAGRFLAEDVASVSQHAAFPADDPTMRRAIVDGFAVSAAVAAGDTLRAAGSLARFEPWPDDPLSPGDAIRVECGATLGADVAAVVPVAAVTIRSGILHVGREVRSGAGVGGGSRAGARAWPASTRVTARLQAFLLDRGRTDVEVYTQLRVGVLVVGGELTDLSVSAAEGQRHDLTGAWLSEALRALGLDVVPLGIVAGEPAAIADSVLRARHRRVDVLVTCGGLGDGIGDRTAEGLKVFGCDVVLDRLALHGCESFLYAKHDELEVLGLSGRPLSAAAGYDLLLEPYLLWRLGAARELWDWTRQSFPLRLEDGFEPPHPAHPPNEAWWLLAARVGVSDAGGGPYLEAWLPESTFSPCSARAGGWALVDPGSGSSRPGTALFQTLRA